MILVLYVHMMLWHDENTESKIFRWTRMVEKCKRKVDLLDALSQLWIRKFSVNIAKVFFWKTKGLIYKLTVNLN
jgi:uncharacterized protein YigA (DUF484 family)